MHRRVAAHEILGDDSHVRLGQSEGAHLAQQRS
jgi:hypothetical protein